MIVDKTHRYIYVSVPKTGSISLQFALGYGHDIPEPDLYHRGIADILVENPDCSDYFKFAFIRNPWDRLVSLYFDFTKKRVNQYSQLVCYDKPLLSEFADFEDLCLRLPESSWANDVFFRSQFAQLSVGGKLAVDFLGRFEALESDFGFVCRRLALQIPALKKMNTGVYDKSSYRQYYSEAAKNAVANLYQDDVECFGYEF